MSDLYPSEIDRIREAWDAGVRARDWPVEELPKAIAKASYKWQEAYVRQIAYYHALDSGNLRNAQVQIACAVQEAVRHPWQSLEFLPRLQFEQAYVQAMLGEELDFYERCLTEYDFPFNDAKLAWNRARAAMKAAWGDLEEARSLVQLAKDEIAEQHPEIKPNIQAELDWLDNILIRFEETSQ